MTEVGALILAGGKGTRLGGVNKADLEVGGRTTLERVLDALRQLELSEMVLVSNEDVVASAPGARVILDPEPHAGVLPALLAGLEALASELAITAACDMPFLSPSVYRLLLAQAEDHDVVIPEVDGQLEPMCAVYRRVTCSAAVRRALAEGDRRMTSFLDRVKVRRVSEGRLRGADPSLLGLFNINTPADLERARRLAKGGLALF